MHGLRTDACEIHQVCRMHLTAQDEVWTVIETNPPHTAWHCLQDVACESLDSFFFGTFSDITDMIDSLKGKDGVGVGGTEVDREVEVHINVLGRSSWNFGDILPFSLELIEGPLQAGLIYSHVPCIFHTAII